MTDEKPGDPGAVRPATRALVTAIALDTYPGVPTCADFGIRSQRHYEALYYPLRNAEITPGQLEAALGDGPKLTALVNAAPSNPHRGITFETPWDGLKPQPDREPGEPPAASPPPPEEENHPRPGLTLLQALYRGVPIPAGFAMPEPPGPAPPASDPAALERAGREVQALQGAVFTSWVRDPSLAVGTAFAPGPEGRWEDISGLGRLAVLDHFVNWRGVSATDKAALLGQAVDGNSVAEEVRRRFHQTGAEKPRGHPPKDAAGKPRGHPAKGRDLELER
jgi:hypothetical protein